MIQCEEHTYWPEGFLKEYLVEECLDCGRLQFYAEDTYDFRRALWEAMENKEFKHYGPASTEEGSGGETGSHPHAGRDGARREDERYKFIKRRVFLQRFRKV